MKRTLHKESEHKLTLSHQAKYVGKELAKILTPRIMRDSRNFLFQDMKEYLSRLVPAYKQSQQERSDTN